MNAVTPFDFEGAAVRVIEIDGEPWFVATDVANVLGYSNPRDAIAKHCKAAMKHRLDVGRNTVADRDGIPGNPNVTIIPERDLYRLIMRSKLPAAERFEEWVVGEVLPAIRKTGRYAMPGVAAEEVDVAPAFAMAAMSLTPRELNAWTRYLETVRSIFSRPVAAAQYPKTPLPALARRHLPDAEIEMPGLDGAACLAHLLGARINRTTLTIGDLVRIAKRDARTREQLGAAGVFVDPTNWRGWVAVAVEHPRLQRVFTDTIWAPGWSMALLAIKGARPSLDRILFPDGRRRAVLLPWEAIERTSLPEVA